MKKSKSFLAFMAILLTCALGVQAQEDNSYFLDSWNVLVKGTPEGDAEMPMRFVKNGDAISGYFINPENEEEEEMDSAEIKDGALLMAFYVAGYDVTMTMKKETENTMKGSLLGMFDAEASRVVDENSYFLDNWIVLVKGTPEGDAELPMRFEKNGDNVSGYFINPENGDEEGMDSAEIKDGALLMAFYVAGYDVTMSLKKETENTMTGSLMDMFEAEATRVVEVELEEETISLDDYFLSSWDVLVEGTPNGDVIVPMRFEEGDGGLEGYFTDPQDGSEHKMTSLEQKDGTISGGFTLMDYDLNFYLKVEDANQAKGSLMDMFNMIATRLEE